MNNNLSSDLLNLLASSIDGVLENLFQLFFFRLFGKKNIDLQKNAFVIFRKDQDVFFNCATGLLAFYTSYLPPAFVLLHFSR